MTTDPLTTSTTITPSTQTTTRRRLLTRAAAGLGSIGVVAAAARTLGGRAPISDASGVTSINGPAVASRPAERLGVPPTEITTPGSGKLVFPIDPDAKSYVLDNFGDCRSGGSRQHAGVDIISERGAPVYAVADGVLSGQFLDTGAAGFGWTLRGDDGDSYRYFHLDSFAEGLDKGDRVRFGEVIGYVGSSGNLIWVDGERVEDRNNIHLHFEVLRDHRQAVDPLPLIEVPDGIGIGAPLKSCLWRG